MMYCQEDSLSLIKRQHNSSNVNVNSGKSSQRYIICKTGQPTMTDKSVISVVSRLPVRSRSVTDRAHSHRKTASPPKPKLGSVSTWSDLSLHSGGKVRSSSASLTRMKSISVKAELLSKNPGGKSTVNFVTGFKYSNKLPQHRNNSSCVGTTRICKENVPAGCLKTDNTAAGLKGTAIVVHNKGVDSKTAAVVSNNHSIFKFFKLKVNSYREKHEQKAEVKNKEPRDNKTVSESKSMKKDSLNILDHPKTKEFLIKLYNECKKLNGNITKLYSDTNHRHGPLKNLLERSPDSAKSHRRSRSSNNVNRNLSLKEVHENSGDARKSESDLVSKKDNEGHYYHLACVLSPDMVNTTTNYTKTGVNNDLHQSQSTKRVRDKSKIRSEEVTNISSVKSNASVSLSTSVVHRDRDNFGKRSGIIKNKFTVTNELDDTLCDLDEDMKTDSSEMSHVNVNELKSPMSNSNYVTANELDNTPAPRRSVDIKKDSPKVSSSLELPPIPSVAKDYEITDSFTKLEPPQSLVEAYKDSSNAENQMLTENQSSTNKFITIFEKQFPQRFVLRQSPVNEEEKRDPHSNFSSTLTVNCSKATKKTVNNIHHFKFFNPFKPPKSYPFKQNEYLNTNNNNSENDGNDGNEGPSNTLEVMKPIICDLDTSKEPLERVAPLKKLLQHSRTSEQMNEVINLQQPDGRSSPSLNSCIEKQRQKKLARQKEQHQRAKDMAIEAARLRKERQSEMNSLDSLNSSRIVDQLFTENTEDGYPDFSLFDAIHYNFKEKKPRRPRPLMPSTITGILPEGDPEPIEPPKSPMTTEKFRSQPLRVDKRKPNTEIDKEILARYAPIGSLPFVPKEAQVPEAVVKLAQPIDTKKVEYGKSKIKEEEEEEEKTSSSTSVSWASSCESLDSWSSVSSSSSSSSSSIKTRRYRKPPRQPRRSKCLLNEDRKDERQSPDENKGNRKILKKEILVKIETDVSQEREQRTECDIATNTPKETTDVNVGTEQDDDDNDKEDDRFQEIMVAQRLRSMNLSTGKTTSSCDLLDRPDCHLNHQMKYRDNVIDRTLPLNISLPTPNTSLSSFVHELNTQLHSLADTVDILLNRMDVLELNILDCSKYFLYK